MKLLWKKEIRQGEEITPNQIVQLLIENRGIKNVDEFLNPPSPLNIKLEQFSKSFPASLKKVLKLLERIKKENGTIVVYTDYDADGITGGAILWETLHLLGFKTMPYVPHRVTEGYGFSLKGIDSVKKQFDPDLIISVDHGITAEKKIAYAKSLGIPIVITDHHLKSDTPPASAFAVFHVPELSGSGVAYFFAKAVFEHFSNIAMPAGRQEYGISNINQLRNYFKADYLTFASIGTVADLVPLTGISRAVVKHGLAQFPKIRRVGIIELLKQAGIERKPITTYEVGFIIAPRINAVGRLEHAIEALRLLCTNDKTKAQELTAKISKKNSERQDLVTQSVLEAEKIVIKKKLLNSKLLILYSDSWHEGVIGLIASKLVEKFYRPVIIMTKSGLNYKGSARSIPAFHMTNSLREHKNLLIDVGGHAQAAGFTIESKNLDKFISALTSFAAKKLTNEDLVKTVTADIKLPISLITKTLIDKLEQLKPTGMGNPNPSFLSVVAIEKAYAMGKEQQHLKFYSENGMEFVAFGKGDLLKSLSRGEVREIVYCPELNEWNGNQRITCRVLHM
mgnify:CR=1 FL=1